MGKSKANKVQVPDCRYGAACTRRDCVFRHPPRPKHGAAAPASSQTNKSDKVCFSFIAGRCAFGRQCRDQHPDAEACRSIQERYARMDCQWGRGCRTEGCLYKHPMDEPMGPALAAAPVRQQPAVFAEGPKIGAGGAAEEARKAAAAAPAQVLLPKAIAQATDLRDLGAFYIADPLDRFLAVNARNTGTQSAALLDLHFQSAQTVGPLLEEVLPERLRMFPDGVWVIFGTPKSAQEQHQFKAEIAETLQKFLRERKFDFAPGFDSDGVRWPAFFVRGYLRPQGPARSRDPLEGVRAVMLCGTHGSGKTTLAETLVRKSQRFVHVSQDNLDGDCAACEEEFKKALAPSSAPSAAARSKKAWHQLFSSERQFLGIALRTSSVRFLESAIGFQLPQAKQRGPVQPGVVPEPSRAEFLYATFAFNPIGLELRRRLGRIYKITFRCFVMLEATMAPFVNDVFRVVLCSATPTDGAGDARPIPLHIPLGVPRAALGHLQVLNAVPIDKKIMTNSVLGSFKVRRSVELTSVPERFGLCVLAHKTGSEGVHPGATTLSFDAEAVASIGAGRGVNATTVGAGRSGKQWTDLGDAALASVDPLVIIEKTEGAASDAEWQAAVAARSLALGMEPPKVQVSRPLNATEGKVAQWLRLKPGSLIHCVADASEVPHFISAGAAVLPLGGDGVATPAPPQDPANSLPRVVLLDRCNAGRQERRHWIERAGLKMSQVFALHLDVPETECIMRLAQRGARHPTVKVVSMEDAEAVVRDIAARMEAPSDGEGFHGTLRLTGAGGVWQHLVRQWSSEAPAEDFRPGASASAGSRAAIAGGAAGFQDGEDSGEEAAPPPLPTLNQWISQADFAEAMEHQQRQPAVWGGLGFGVPPPMGVATASSAAPCAAATAISSAAVPSHHAAWGPLGIADGTARGLLGAPGLDLDAAAAWGVGPNAAVASSGASGLEPPSEAPPPEPPGLRQGLDEEDDEDLAYDEQLAATLRCMGFDDEPSQQAASRSGGNLNAAVEAALLNGDAVS
eukprot:TRINITY_DN25571_c0_g3_i1.p1 TRINITY_DN25571_c0_g3~~TRINITY_DN25571_c0_g3_i1.p1  ORF type:complete len:1052 (+),score=237.55 TRINITY_DN25571_c0_g3_i1:96-3158(+)